MKINVAIKGTAPLLLHKYAVEEKKSSRAQKVYVPEEEAEKCCYRTEDGKVFIPSTHFKGAMIKSGVDFVFKGKKTYKEYIKSGIFIEENEIILTPQEYIINNTPVVISRARIMRSRPEFRDWKCKFTMEITDDALDFTVVKEILVMAGKYKGVGDFRPEYGRFEVVSFEKAK